MNLDDESLLSAFLDDELDPGDRQAVAWQVESSPEVTARLAELRGVQVAVQNLSRPVVPVDLSAAVLARLTPRGPATGTAPPVLPMPVRFRRRRWATAARAVASLVGVGSVAASLLFALVLLFNALHETDRPAETSIVATESTPNRTHPTPAPTIAARQTRSLAPVADLAPAAPPAPAKVAQETLVVVERAKSPLPDQSRRSLAKSKEPVATVAEVDSRAASRPEPVDTMLGMARVSRVVIPTDTLDQTAQRVRQIIDEDADRAPEYGQISLTGGIVVDPGQPGAAEVYPVVLREADARAFLVKLRREFAEAAVEDEAAPALVTQLAEVGPVALHFRINPSRLGEPPHNLNPFVATKASPVEVDLDGDLAAKPRDKSPLGNLIDQQRQRQGVHRAADQVQTTLGRPAGGPTNPGPVTILVWVARRVQP